MCHFLCSSQSFFVFRIPLFYEHLFSYIYYSSVTVKQVFYASIKLWDWRSYCNWTATGGMEQFCSCFLFSESSAWDIKKNRSLFVWKWETKLIWIFLKRKKRCLCFLRGLWTVKHKYYVLSHELRKRRVEIFKCFLTKQTIFLL